MAAGGNRTGVGCQRAARDAGGATVHGDRQRRSVATETLVAIRVGSPSPTSALFPFGLFPSPSCVCPSERLWKLYLNHWIRQATRLDALARLPACPPGAAAQHFDQHRRHYSLLFATFFNQNNYRGNGIAPATATASATANVQAPGGSSSGTNSSDVPLATSEPVDPAAYVVPALAAGAEAGTGAGDARGSRGSSGVLGRLRRYSAPAVLLTYCTVPSPRIATPSLCASYGPLALSVLLSGLL